jgi:hypothetical protein
MDEAMLARRFMDDVIAAIKSVQGDGMTGEQVCGMLLVAAGSVYAKCSHVDEYPTSDVLQKGLATAGLDGMKRYLDQWLGRN